MSILANTVPPARDAAVAEAGAAMREAVDRWAMHVAVCRWRRADLSCARCDGLDARATAAEDRFEAARMGEAQP